MIKETPLPSSIKLLTWAFYTVISHGMGKHMGAVPLVDDRIAIVELYFKTL